jgi:hypothetical protein
MIRRVSGLWIPGSRKGAPRNDADRGPSVGDRTLEPFHTAVRLFPLGPGRGEVKGATASISPKHALVTFANAVF